MRVGGATMGTSWSALYATPAVSPELARVTIESRLAEIAADMSHWDSESSLSSFNRGAAGSWHGLSADLAAVITAALGVAEASGGAFDPAIGRIVDLLGFGPPGAQPAPSAEALAAALDQSGVQYLAFDPFARRLRQPGGLALDLSGIAKGYAVDAIGQVLDGLGAQDWLVEIGGELKGRGMRPDGDPWWVDLEVPPGARVAAIRIALHGLAVATSGDYRRGAHTIDPRTGRSIANGVRSVSVVHPSAMLADAWATALTVLGPHDGLALAETRGIAAQMIVERDGAATEYLSTPLQTMIEG